MVNYMKILKEFNTFIILSAAITILSYLIPLFNFLIYPNILLLSLIQEITHGLLCLIIKKEIFISFIVENSEKSTLKFITISETLGIPFMILLGYICSKTNTGSRILLTIISIFFIITETLWTKNYYGFLLIGFFCMVFLWLALSRNYKTTQMLLFFCSLQLNIALFFKSNHVFAILSDSTIRNSNVQIELFFPLWMYKITYISFLVMILSLGLKSAIKAGKCENLWTSKSL